MKSFNDLLEIHKRLRGKHFSSGVNGSILAGIVLFNAGMVSGSH